jgi:hypothetical protein
MKPVESDFKLKLKDYYTTVSCGGNSLIRTAMPNKAVETSLDASSIVASLHDRV